MEKMRERFIPTSELETLEIDVKNKVFRVNGRDFGKDATQFLLHCNPSGNPGEFWHMSFSIDTTATYIANYDIEGKPTSAIERLSENPLVQEEAAL